MTDGGERQEDISRAIYAKSSDSDIEEEELERKIANPLHPRSRRRYKRIYSRRFFLGGEVGLKLLNRNQKLGGLIGRNSRKEHY